MYFIKIKAQIKLYEKTFAIIIYYANIVILL